MGLFSKEETVFELKDEVLGEVDSTSDTGTGYANVKHYPYKVKKRRMVRAHLVSEKPIDIVLAYPDGRLIAHKEGITDDIIGPVTTEDFTEMGVIIGIFPGEKTAFSVKIWTDSK